LMDQPRYRDWAGLGTRDISSNGQLPPPKKCPHRRPAIASGSSISARARRRDCDDRNRPEMTSRTRERKLGNDSVLLTPYNARSRRDPGQAATQPGVAQGPQETGCVASLERIVSIDQSTGCTSAGAAICALYKSGFADRQRRASRGWSANMSRVGSVRSNRPCGATRMNAPPSLARSLRHPPRVRRPLTNHQRICGMNPPRQ